MKIKKSELIKITKEAVAEVLHKKILRENTDFISMRWIEHFAAEIAIKFEEVIIKELGLKNPNQLTPEAQEAYKQIANELKAGISNAVLEAVKKLQTFPRVVSQDKNKLKQQ